MPPPLLPSNPFANESVLGEHSLIDSGGSQMNSSPQRELLPKVTVLLFITTTTIAFTIISVLTLLIINLEFFCIDLFYAYVNVYRFLD